MRVASSDLPSTLQGDAEFFAEEKLVASRGVIDH